ncbi:MAG: histidinol-phosphate transaminase [Alphaproteobacteria bacterium GM202ARS2]|nr:histidinol-phosphate transaminase [Alphaproteobacteria bacterium GM202ARS2]
MTASSSSIKPLPYVAGLAPYQSGETHARGHSAQGRIFKLSSNESVFGASPQAIEAGQNWLARHETHRYPPTDCRDLRAALAARHKLPKEQLMVGNGSDELISLLIHAYCGVGDEVVMSRYGFIYYRVVAQSVGATVIDVDEDESLQASKDAFVRACSPRTKLMFIANPNNPTGFVWQAGELEALAAALPEHVLLVVDAAYAEYATATHPSYQGGSGLVKSGRCVMLRTFSKLYGLSALRVGWGYMPDHVIASLSPLRPPFNVNGLAQVMATASLKDDTFYDKVVQETCHRRDEIIADLRKMNHVRVYDSGGNFFLVRWADAETAETMAMTLSQQGLIVRQLKDYQLDDCLRVTVGCAESMALFVAAVRGNSGSHV